MTGLELVRKTIDNESRTGIPYCIHLTRKGISAHGEELLKRYSNDKIRRLYSDGTITLDDAIKLAIGNNVFPLYPPWWGFDDRQTEFKTELDIPHFNIKTFGNGSYEGFMRKISLVKEMTDCYVLALVYCSHIEKLQALRGFENSLADMVGDDVGTKKMSDFIIRKNLVMIENCVYNDNLDGVLLGSDWGTQRGLLISPDLWREMIKPGEKQEYDLIKSAHKDVWVHSCGNITDIIPDLIEMGVDVLNPIQPECMNIYDLSDCYGKDITFWGGISTQQTLPYGTPQQVAKETRYVMEYMNKNGGYITGPSQEIQGDVPFENVCALIDTAKGAV